MSSRISSDCHLRDNRFTAAIPNASFRGPTLDFRPISLVRLRLYPNLVRRSQLTVSEPQSALQANMLNLGALL